MAQFVSSLLGDLARSSRGIAHSDDVEGRKSSQYNKFLAANPTGSNDIRI